MRMRMHPEDYAHFIKRLDQLYALSIISESDEFLQWPQEIRANYAALMHEMLVEVRKCFWRAKLLPEEKFCGLEGEKVVVGL